ncbi:ATP-binding protein [Actinomadura oligospora]|uniref:ATP-binding protein n=1 Tax=Actinomadura oligospora TaxID=111804 RepID=UPI000687BFE6|nr:ATP-binding protein [Actinomadura oligospora]
MDTTTWRYSTAAEWLHDSGPMRWRRTYRGELQEVSKVRRLARMMFAGDECADVVEFAVAELAANTLRHTRSGEEGGWFGVELAYGDPVYVGVTDLGGGGIPAVRQVDERQESGRGLYMVSQLALAMGIHGSPALGHTVWVDLNRRQTLETLGELSIPLAS